MATDVESLRQGGMITGLVLTALGIVAAGAAVLVHAARALPLAELPARAGVWWGALFLLPGVVLLGLAHRRRAACRPPAVLGAGARPAWGNEVSTS